MQRIALRLVMLVVKFFSFNAAATCLSPNHYP
jgi:hypothetical protein